MKKMNNQTNIIALMLAVIATPDQNTQGHQPDAPENVANKVSAISSGDAERNKQTEHNENCRDKPQP